MAAQDRLAHLWKHEIPGIMAGVVELERRTGIAQTESPECIARRALLVKFAREGDAYASIGMHRSNMDEYFSIEGEARLWQAAAERRPIVLMTGHFGSFFTISIALGFLGFRVHPIARVVAHTPDNPWPRRIFEHLNYFQTRRRMRGQYLYTDFAGQLDRRLVTVCREGGIVLVLTDLPHALFPAGRSKLTLLKFDSSLPGGMVEFGLKYDAIFLTLWNAIDVAESGVVSRRLRIEPPMMAGDAVGILQEYADRLSAAILAEPWQWMGLPILSKFIESETA